MKTIWTIARRELKALFDHPTGYILLVVFLVLNNFLFFRQVYIARIASLRPMLELLPWVFLFFVPAITMRALAEDFRSGTLEVVLAQPVSELELLVGKYAGQVLFIWIALALTLPIMLGLSFGADLQVGVIVAQYTGAALLAGGLAAMGLWASSLTRNQITAFIVSVAVIFPLILLGTNPIIAGLPPRLSAFLANLTVVPHFFNIARGVIDLRDVVYFATVAAMFLALAYRVLMLRKLARGRVARRRLQLGTALIAATLIVVNLFGRHIGGRLDLTPARAYTLSLATRDLLRELDDLLTIKLFVSKELPTEIALMKRDIADLLGDFRSAGGGRVRVVERDPADDEEAQTEARALGILPVQFNVIGEAELQVKNGFLGIAVQYADGSETIPFVQRTDDLEYRLASFVQSLTRTDTSVVGLIESAPQPGPPIRFTSLRRELGQNHEVRTLSTLDSTPIPEEVRVLILAGTPPSLSDSQVQRFTEYFRRGGSALVMTSGMRLQPQGSMASPQPVAWNRVLEPFHVTVRSDMAYDLGSNESVSIPASFGRLFVQYPFWVRAVSTRLSPINQDIDAMLLPWVSTVDTTGAVSGAVIPLFTTSGAGGVEAGTAFVDPRRRFSGDSLAPRLLAALVNPAAADGESELTGRLVVVGNTDFASDQFAESFRTGLLFVLNAVDWLAQDQALISIRSKERRPPPLVFESRTTRDVVRWGNVMGVPLLLIVFASGWLFRRRQRARRVYRPAESGDA